ncbi:MAG: decaprenyl-phosphate phosphoribosyltransferase [Ignavibacteriales bacterium]|nr:decaprenyl-phosphate phosphoribosyltransferase [Ignavibacteriales bacterium]
MAPYFSLLRPQQWVKNLFLFAPLIFSKHLFDVDFLLTELLAFIAFCLISSTVYALNDIADREADKLHPVKQHRSIASGRITIPQALMFEVFLLAVVVFLSMRLSVKFQAAAGMYFLLNLAYSFWLKKVILVDVFVIAAGFMLRVLAGAFAIDVQVSPWLVLCTLFVSVFLAVSKRRGEILLNVDSDSRPVLKEYDISFIDQIMTVAASGMAISYALYTVAERTVTIFGTENLIFTTVFVLFGIFRYLFLVKKHRAEDNPTLLLLKDGVMMLNVLAWFLSCVVIIYFNEIKGWLN